MMTRREMQPAFVLHSRPYRDTSSIIEFFTLEHGRISAIARGVRSPRSKVRGLLQPFTPLVISTSGRYELAYLNKIECDGCPFLIDSAKLLSGIYLNQLLLRFLARHDPHKKLYLIYQETLAALCEESQAEIVLRKFEFKLLEQIGYGISLTQTAEGKPIEENIYYHFEPQQGFIAKTKAYGKQYLGKWLLAWANQQFHHQEVQKTAKAILIEAMG